MLGAGFKMAVIPGYFFQAVWIYDFIVLIDLWEGVEFVILSHLGAQ